MADNNFIKHAFVSPKSDGPDTTLVRPSNWNDGLVYAGGINGQILVYNNAQDNNMRWVDGPTSPSGSAYINVSTGSPLLNQAAVSFTANTPRIAAVTYTIAIYTSVGNAGATVSLIYDSSEISSFGIPSPLPAPASFTFPLSITAGAHTLSLKVVVSGGVNVLTFSAFINCFMIGV